MQLVHPDDRNRVSDAMGAAMYGTELFSCDYRIIRPDGEIRWVKSLGIVQLDRPTNASMTGTITDITERRAAEQALLHQERAMRSLADNTPDILTRFDRQLRYVFVNSAIENPAGRGREELSADRCGTWACPEALCQLWESALVSVFETQEQKLIEYAYTGPTGERLYATRLVPERGPSGETEYVLGVTQDVTVRKQAEEALKKADQRKDEFLATLAHELRNPLAPIRNAIEKSYA